MNENYVLVRWPESQEFMECDWFRDEAILALGHEDQTGSSAYFIPESRILTKEYVQQRVAELCRDYEVTPEEEDYSSKQWCDEAFPDEGGMSLKELIVEIALLVRKRSTLQDDKKYDGEM